MNQYRSIDIQFQYRRPHTGVKWTIRTRVTGNGDDDQDAETGSVGHDQQGHSISVPGPEQPVHDGHRQRHHVERGGHKLHFRRIPGRRGLYAITAELGGFAQSQQQPFQILVVGNGTIFNVVRDSTVYVLRSIIHHNNIIIIDV